MNTVVSIQEQLDHNLQAVFDEQMAAFRAAPSPSIDQRLAKLKKLEHLLLDNRQAIIDALMADFGHRCEEETRMAEISGSVVHIRYAIKHLAKWMRPESRDTSIWFLPGKNHIQAQPLGVVGIMSPWNYPINLAVAPLASALAAGNRAMIKMSEFTPHSNAALQEILAREFDRSEVAIFTGEADQAAQFSQLPFNHLLFTGSTGVGRRVMAAAAKNLTPLTLELGGKSPVIISETYSIEEAAERILWGKQFNAGQTCVAPDYILLPKGQSENFRIWMARKFADMHPDGCQSKDYSAVINDRNRSRLEGLLEDAAKNGAKICSLDPENGNEDPRKLAPTLVINPDFDSRIMQEEIFGPLLPVIEMEDIESCIDYINTGERPLALYYFGHSEKEKQIILKRTHSGSVSINEVLVQYLQASQPFGGVGASGFGSYHGKEGFRTFSHMKPVFQQRGIGGFTGLKLLHPPYNNFSRKLIEMMGG